jgi:hypothetical protein
MIDAADLLAYLGRPSSSETLILATQHLAVVTAFVKAYTRGKGFDEYGDPAEDVGRVILTATARLHDNPEQAGRYTIGDVSESPAILSGFTLIERAVLNQYRRRTA